MRLTHSQGLLAMLTWLLMLHQEICKRLARDLQALDEDRGASAALHNLTACIQGQRASMQESARVENQQALQWQLLGILEGVRSSHLRWSSHAITRQHALALVGTIFSLYRMLVLVSLVTFDALGCESAWHLSVNCKRAACLPAPLLTLGCQGSWGTLNAIAFA